MLKLKNKDDNNHTELQIPIQTKNEYFFHIEFSLPPFIILKKMNILNGHEDMCIIYI